MTNTCEERTRWEAASTHYELAPSSRLSSAQVVGQVPGPAVSTGWLGQVVIFPPPPQTFLPLLFLGGALLTY